MNYQRFIGCKTKLNSNLWGPLEIESESFTPASDGDLVVYIGNPLQVERPIVRIHSECVFSEVFDSDFCDCAEQLNIAMNYLVESQKGILFYLRFDGRGAGLSAKVEATRLEMEGYDTYESRKMIGVAPEGRDFTNIGLFLINKGISKVSLLTNSPTKIEGLRKAGIDVEVIPLIVTTPNDNVKKLYETKAKKFNHIIPNYKYED